MLTLNVVSLSGDSRINGSLNGATFNVPFTKESYANFVQKQQDLASIEVVEDFDIWTTSVQSLIDGIPQGDVITSACPDLMLDSKTGKYYLNVDGKTSKFAVPDKLVEVILESVEKDIDATPIIKAWTRFLRNPNLSEDKAYNFASYITAIIIDNEEADRLIDEEGYTEEKASERAAYNDVAITQEGLIVARKYATLLTEGWTIDPKTNEAVKGPLFPTVKSVDKFSGETTEEVTMPEFAEELTFEPPVMGRRGNAFFCGEKEDHLIKVGELHKLDSWSKVNCNDNNSCVAGLHVGGWRYVQSYKGLNAQLLECFVDPSEIGAICGLEYDSDGAMRVKEYFIYGAVKGRTKGIYHSSKYAALKDSEWLAYKLAAIEESNKKTADLADSLT